MRFTRWFLPDEPDVVGLLRVQVGITLEGLDAYAAWATGDADAARLVREAEVRGDEAKRGLRNALRAAFVVPLEPEDVFALSRGIDWILDYTCDLVAEAEVMECAPDAGIAEMATLLGEAVRELDEAIVLLGRDGDSATEAAEAAIEAEHRLEASYYRGMAALLTVDDRSQRISLRELYRRSSQIGNVIVDTAERVMYAVVKQS
jgi:uncharacterized protein Yka (UPF0111/DUF47 family)